MGDFHGFSGVRDERGEHFELQVLRVSDPVGPALNHPDLIVESLHEAEGDLVIGTAIADDALPVSFHQADELLERLEPAPAQLGLPVLEELPGPGGMVVVPQLPEGLFEEIRLMEPFVGFELTLPPKTGQLRRRASGC